MLAPDPDPAPGPLDLPEGQPPRALDSPTGRGRLVGLALVAGLLAGATAWLAGEAILVAYRSDLDPKVRRGSDVEAGRRFARARAASTAGTYAALGATLGVGLGLAGGLARRRVSAGARAVALGGVVGGIAGASASLLVLPVFDRNYDPQSQDLVLPMLTLGSIALAVGASAGLAFGVGLGGRGRPLRALVGALVGAGLGVAAYEVVGALAFPVSKTELLISHEATTRAMLHLLVAVLASAGAALALDPPPKGQGPASPAA